MCTYVRVRVPVCMCVCTISLFIDQGPSSYDVKGVGVNTGTSKDSWSPETVQNTLLPPTDTRCSLDRGTGIRSTLVTTVLEDRVHD